MYFIYFTASKFVVIIDYLHADLINSNSWTFTPHPAHNKLSKNENHAVFSAYFLQTNWLILNFCVFCIRSILTFKLWTLNNFDLATSLFVSDPSRLHLIFYILSEILPLLPNINQIKLN
jgi:hypothetical protein